MTSRKEGTLIRLAGKFIQHATFSETDEGFTAFEYANALETTRRRLYDVIDILEMCGAVSRKKRGAVDAIRRPKTYYWLGFADLHASMQFILSSDTLGGHAKTLFTNVRKTADCSTEEGILRRVSRFVIAAFLHGHFTFAAYKPRGVLACLQKLWEPYTICDKKKRSELDEKHICRRVYDVLNVLRATPLLTYVHEKDERSMALPPNFVSVRRHFPSDFFNPPPPLLPLSDLFTAKQSLSGVQMTLSSSLGTATEDDSTRSSHSVYDDDDEEQWMMNYDGKIFFSLGEDHGMEQYNTLF